MLQRFRSFPLRAALYGFLALAAGICLFLAAGRDNSPFRKTSPLTKWMKEHAQPFATCEPGDNLDDLAGLKTVVGGARIVALGEGTHGTREFFQLKHRMVQYLATEMGFTVFAIEANLPEAWRVNDYVLGGPGDARELIAGMYFWTWDTEEVLELVEWMRRFNASGRGRIEFTGFDMQTPDTALSIVHRYLAAHEPAWLDTLNVIENFASRDPGFINATGTLPVSDFAGHKVRYSGFIRTKEVSGFAGLWMRADVRSRRAVVFDNMRNQQVAGTKDWQRYAIELAIPADADTLTFGVSMTGQGDAWFDSLTIEIEGAPWSSRTIDLAMEHPHGPIGMTGLSMHPRFDIAMDGGVFKSGSRSLRLSGGPPMPGSRDPARATLAVTQLVNHLEATQSRLEHVSSGQEIEWVIRNAHVILQSQLKVGASYGAVRDSCMASNLEWIAETARKGSKVVIWAHNGHIEKDAESMGGWLDKRYEDDYVAIAMTTGEGTYTALPRRGGRLSSRNPLLPAPRGSIEAAANATELPRFLLDLRSARELPEMDALLRSPLLMRSIGAMADTKQFYPTSVFNDFDALVWIAHTGPSRVFGLATAQLKG